MKISVESLCSLKKLLINIFFCFFVFMNSASQIHRVPRKTLRNWMKRWHIKSVYPMPHQLKQAAEKKRQFSKPNETKTSSI